MIRIEVAYALPERQRVIELQVEEGCTVLQAVRRSGIALEFAEIASGGMDWSTTVLGIFGKVIEQPAQAAVREGDRIEIYRPLRADPKAIRRQRAQRQLEG